MAIKLEIEPRTERQLKASMDFIQAMRDADTADEADRQAQVIQFKDEDPYTHCLHAIELWMGRDDLDATTEKFFMALANAADEYEKAKYGDILSEALQARV